MSGCGPHSEPGRGGIAAPAHVLDHPLGPQRLIQVVGVSPGHCFEHRIRPSGQPDTHGTPIDACRKAAEKSDLCPDHAGHVVQDLGRQLFGMGALIHRLDLDISAHGQRAGWHSVATSAVPGREAGAPVWQCSRWRKLRDIRS